MFRHSAISRRLIELLVLLSLGGAVPAAGQIPEQLNLRVELNEPLCEAVRKQNIRQLAVSTNGREEPTPLTPVAPCVWEKRGFSSLNPAISFFSLRLTNDTIGDRGRTRCRRSKLVDRSTLALTFGEFSEAGSLRLRFDGTPSRYVRIVPTKAGDLRGETGKTDIPCDEAGAVPATLYGVQFDVEEVRVQIFERKDPKCGLALEKTLAKAKGSEIDLTKDLADQLSLQGWKQRLCHASTFVLPEINQKSLNTKNLSLKVKVN